MSMTLQDDLFYEAVDYIRDVFIVLSAELGRRTLTETEEHIMLTTTGIISKFVSGRSALHDECSRILAEPQTKLEPVP
jgi:hypothetical protein